MKRLTPTNRASALQRVSLIILRCLMYIEHVLRAYSYAILNLTRGSHHRTRTRGIIEQVRGGRKVWSAEKNAIRVVTGVALYRSKGLIGRGVSNRWRRNYLHRSTRNACDENADERLTVLTKCFATGETRRRKRLIVERNSG